MARTTAQTSHNFKVTSLTGSETASPTPTITPTPTKVDYYLPYPGMLPDHPLYFLKMVRDKVWLLLTTDPLKKSELLLLFADKRLGAAQVLIQGGKAELGVSTLSKAEKYLEEAIVQANKAKQQNKDTSSLYRKLALATLKHQEVIGEILLEAPPGVKEFVQRISEYPQRGYEEVSKATH